jgi:hypothetical protein
MKVRVRLGQQLASASDLASSDEGRSSGEPAVRMTSARRDREAYVTALVRQRDAACDTRLSREWLPPAVAESVYRDPVGGHSGASRE